MATHNPDINLGRNAQALVSCERQRPSAAVAQEEETPRPTTLEPGPISSSTSAHRPPPIVPGTLDAHALIATHLTRQASNLGPSNTCEWPVSFPGRCGPQPAKRSVAAGSRFTQQGLLVPPGWPVPKFKRSLCCSSQIRVRYETATSALSPGPPGNYPRRYYHIHADALHRPRGPDVDLTRPCRLPGLICTSPTRPDARPHAHPSTLTKHRDKSRHPHPRSPSTSPRGTDTLGVTVPRAEPIHWRRGLLMNSRRRETAASQIAVVA